MSNKIKLDAIRENGTSYHYRLGSGLAWILDAIAVQPEAEALFEQVCLLPSAVASHALATQSIALAKKNASQLGPTYSAIFTVLNEAIQETS